MKYLDKIKMENYKLIERNIRYVTKNDFGKETYCFEVFKRPFLFGLIGKKRWVYVISTTAYDIGYHYAKNLIFK